MTNVERYARGETPQPFWTSFENVADVNCRWRTSIGNSTSVTSIFVLIVVSIAITGR